MDAYPHVGAIVAGRYRIEALLGEGGMGAVFRAVDANGSPFALKFPAPEILSRPGMMSRFANEAQAAARVASEHAVHIFGVEATETGVPFIVMELLQGVDLDRVIEAQAPIDVPRAVHFALQILRALQVAHAAGVVHRDMKPSNCFVIPTPQEPELVKLIDFGITKILGDDAPNMTRTSVTMGTPAYMAPEQARSAKAAEPRSDLYSVGVILYELLTKRRPFEGDSGNELVVKICTEPPLPILTLRPDLPPGLAAAIERALVKNTGSRFANAAAFADALKPFSDARSAAVLARIEGGAETPVAHPSGSGGSTAVMVGGPSAPGAAPWDASAAPPPGGPQRTIVADAPLGFPEPNAATPGAPRPGATVVGDAPLFPGAAPGAPGAPSDPAFGPPVAAAVPPMPPVESMGGRRSSSGGGRGGLIAVLGVAAAALIGTGIYFAVAGSSGSSDTASSEPAATSSDEDEGDESTGKKKKKKKGAEDEGDEGDEPTATADEPSDPEIPPPTPAAATVAPKPTATGTTAPTTTATTTPTTTATTTPDAAPPATDAAPPATDAAPAPTTSTTTPPPTIFLPPGWPKKPVGTATTAPPATTTPPTATATAPASSTTPKLPPIKYLPPVKKGS